MNTLLIDFEPFVEWDNSPFILFGSTGKILYLNNAAEILFGYVSKRELYDMALSYAPHNFGYKTTSLLLTYDIFNFYAIVVGYENEEQISLRLYRTPSSKNTLALDTDKFPMTDINILLGANIALFRANNHATLKLLADQDLPLFKIDQNNFSKILRKVLEGFSETKSIDIVLKLLLGKHVVISGKKELIVKLSFVANNRILDKDDEILPLVQKSHIEAHFGKESIVLDIPLIQ